MKKKILSLAIIAMSVASFGATAQTKTTTSCDTKAKGACVAEECGNPGKQCRKAPCPFDGLTLTDAQKSQLQQLNTSRREARKTEARDRKADKQRGDSARMAARRVDKQEYLKQVKSIVGPEQYVIFLENFYVNGGGQQRTPGKGTIGQGRMAKAHGLRGKAHKGDRPLKAKTMKVSQATAQASN